ncbi:Ran GTPase-activating protein 1, partial [Stegodyphus mimosarum]
MSGIDSLVEKLAGASVEENEHKEVNFAGRALKLNTEDDAAEIVKSIQNCPGMTVLRLEGNTVGIPAAKAIAKALENQPHFKKALWKDMFTRRDKTEIPEALSYLSNGVMVSNSRLVVLDLSDNAFGPRGLIGIVKLLESPSCYSLEELHLNNNGLGISGAKMLADAMCNCIENSRKDGAPLKLKIFVCGRNRLENEGATAVSKFLKQLGTLESVAMPQNGIYSEGIKHLADALSSNPDLKVINLEDNSLTEEGALYIANCLPSLKKLQMLNLGDCLIRTGGALALAKVLKESCSELREIYLGYNEINKEGGKALADAMENKMALELLVLNGNQFGDEGCILIIERMSELGKSDQLGTLSEDEGEDDENDEDDDDDDYNEEHVEEEEESDSQDEISNKSLEDDKSSLHPSPVYKVNSIHDFVRHPTSGMLVSLHDANEDILSLLPEESSDFDYVDLFCKVCSVVDLDNEKVKLAAYRFADDILSKAFSLWSNDISLFNNNFLVGIGLLKGENKKMEKDLDISGILVVLDHVVRQPYFLSSTRSLLQFFLSQPLLYVTANNKAKHILMQTL